MPRNRLGGAIRRCCFVGGEPLDALGTSMFIRESLVPDYVVTVEEESEVNDRQDFSLHTRASNS